MGRKIVRRRVIRATLDGARKVREEKLAGEEPLEIRFGATAYTTSMRTPGDDFDLVAGFLLAEGIIRGSEQLSSMRYCAGTDARAIRPTTSSRCSSGPERTRPNWPPCATWSPARRAGSAAPTP